MRWILGTLLKIAAIVNVAGSFNTTDIDWYDLMDDATNITSCTPEKILCNSTTSDISRVSSHCRCDPDCWKYGDCCLDAAEKVWAQNQVIRQPQWTCEKLPIKPKKKDVYLYMITQCPANWSDSYTEKMCHRKISKSSSYWYVQDVPVMSKSSGKIYVNIFCAVCHKDMRISDTTVDFHCNIEGCLKLISKGTYVPQHRYWIIHNPDTKEPNDTQKISFSVNYFENFTSKENVSYRLCKDSVEDCIHVPANHPDRVKCRLFTAYVYNNNPLPYKNFFCAKCNNDSLEGLQCSNHGVGKHHHITPVDQETILMTPSYSLLLDFSSLTTGSDKHHHHHNRCKVGEVFDPLQKQCVMFYCSKGYIKKGNVCIPEKPTEIVTLPAKNLGNVTERSGLDNISSVSSFPRSRISDPFCRRVLHENFTIFLNDSILIDSVLDEIFEIGEYELINDTAVLVCVPNEVFCPSKYSTIQKIVTIICLPLSLTCLAIHVIASVAMQKYKNLPGKNILSLSIMLFLAQILFVFIDSIRNHIFCYVFAAVVHFCFLSTFFWSSVLAADLCRNLFNPQGWKDGTKQWKAYICYAIYAWMIPLFIVGLALIIDNTSILPMLHPDYGVRLCWFSKAYALLVFFAVPLAILLLQNIVFFGITAHGIYKSTKAANRLRAQRDRTQLFLYVKLAFIMGLTWAIGFVASLVNYEPLWIAFIVLNALQGTFIFISFTLNREIIKKIQDFFASKFRNFQSTKTDELSSASTAPSSVAPTPNISSRR